MDILPWILPYCPYPVPAKRWLFQKRWFTMQDDFWVILILILAGFCFLRLGTDRPKCLKINFLCGSSCDFAKYTFWTTCHILCNVSNCLISKCLCSQCLQMLLLGQWYIKLTGLGFNHQFSLTNFVKSHKKSHETVNTSLGWSIPVIIFQNPSGLFLFGTHRDRKTSEPVFLTKFDLKS